jgi:hypothetical protein
MTVADLHSYLLEGSDHALGPQLLDWLTSSRRFAAFAAAAGSKVRKKLRGAQTPGSAADLQFELETAYLLLQERFLIDYEPQVSGQPRRPDFAVTFTTQATVMLEVTRLRSAPVQASAPTLPLHPERLADTVAGKLGQLLPGQSNVLLIGCPAPTLTPDDLRAAMLELQGRAERADAAVLKRAQLGDRSAFFGHYRRLSEVLICELPRRAGTPLSVWVNPQAKQPLPRKVQTALYRSQRGWS